MMKYLDKGIELINKIKSYGYEAYLIGGCVRDFLLNIQSNDIDITTSMPLELLKKEFKCKENGPKYLSIIIKYEGINFEVTHFRKDIEYIDNRHPIVEESDNLLEDTLRRDFTINALAIDADKKIIDYHDGLSDLEKRQIKAIGDPRKRFEEDSLRILRALYFAAKLNFSIEDNTLEAIKEKAHLLSNLSNDRIYEYFTKILSAKTKRGVDYIVKYDLFRYIPDFKDWFNATGYGYTEDELVYFYYLKYNKFPVIVTKLEKKLCLSLAELVKNGYSDYALYKHQDTVYKLGTIFDKLGVSSKDLKQRINELPIRRDSDLAVSKLEITEYFEANYKSAAVNEIISSIVSRKLKNDRLSILEYIEVLKNAR